MNRTTAAYLVLLMLTGCSGVRESVSQRAGSLYEAARSTFSRSPAPAPSPSSPPTPPSSPSSAPTPTPAPSPFTSISPAAAQSYFSTRVCGVQIDGRTKEARLRIEVVPSSRLPAHALIEVQFENPADASAPLVVPTVHKGGGRNLVVLSPPVKGVRARNYEVVVRLYDSSERKTMLAAAAQPCPSLVDDREL